MQLCRTAGALEDFPPKHQGRDEKVFAFAFAFAIAIQITVTAPAAIQIPVAVAVAVTTLVAIIDDPTQPS